jgi:hypothetical protein
MLLKRVREIGFSLLGFALLAKVRPAEDFASALQ